MAPCVLVLDDEVGRVGSVEHSSFIRVFGGLPFSFVFSDCRSPMVGYTVPAALRAVESQPEAVLVLLDMEFEGAGARMGLMVLEEAKRRGVSVPFVVVTRTVDTDLVVRCLRAGARDYLLKGCSADELKQTIETYRLRFPHGRSLIGESGAMLALRQEIEKVAAVPDIAVLVRGERGTGKELVARLIHDKGPHASGPFIALNCAGMPRTLLESELFGVEKGAYTGADRPRPGLIEAAEGGTLFLDEIGSMPLEMQPTLLRVLQERMVRRVGATVERPVSFRVIAASNADLGAMAQTGSFRADLLDRLRQFELRTVPLRDAGADDIARLAAYLLEDVDRRLGPARGGVHHELSPRALACLQAYSWPGNVRELSAALFSACVRAGSAQVDVEDLPPEVERACGATDAPSPAIARPSVGTSGLLPEAPAALEGWSLYLARIELRILRALFLRTGRNKAATMRALYPKLKETYFNRVAYDWVARYGRDMLSDPRIRQELVGFDEFTAGFEREVAIRSKGKAKA